MLDLYSRECPRCSAHLEGEGVRCPSCHRFLPRKLSKTRRIVENSAIGVLMVAIAVALIAPDLARVALGRKPAQASAAAMRPWRGPGPEPEARAWAYPLEESLQGVCRTTFERYLDRKFVVGSVTQYLPAATRALGQELTQESLRLAPDEEKDALAILADDDRFMPECLRVAYEAIDPCEPFKSDLTSAQASACMLPRVSRALAPAPLRQCATAAKLPRVRRACELAADQAVKLAEKK